MGDLLSFFGIVPKEAKNSTSPWKLRFNLLTNTNYDYVRSSFLRCEIRRERRRAWIRRCLRLDRRDARLQFGPNRARIVAEPGLHSSD